MTKPLLALALLCIVSSKADAQRINIPLTQVDNRFTLSAQRYYSSLGGSENYWFFVQNNTNEEYELVVKVTLHLACVGSKNFILGVNKIVHLKPGGKFTPDGDWSHLYTSGSDNFKNCRVADGNSFTLYQSMEYEMTNIENITRKKAEQEKKKNDAIAADKKKQEDAAKQKQLDDEKKKQAESVTKTTQQQPANSNTTTQRPNSGGTSSSKADDDFWRTGQKSTSSQNSNTGIDKSKLPEFIRTTDGKYYHKEGDNIREVSYDQYMALKKQRADQKATQQNNANKLTPEQQQKAVDDIMTKIKADQQRQEEFTNNLVAKTNQFSSALAASSQVEESKRELKENSNMQGNYESVDQLMADFNQKMASINSTVATLNEQRNAYVNSMSDAMYSDPGEEVFNQGAKLIGGIINSAKEAKERKEAQARLKAQKDAALVRMKEEEARLLTGIRTDLFQRFKEGSLPLSSTKVQANTIYYFVYSYDRSQLAKKDAVLYVSNVFAVDRYGDGTWPFKTSISNEIAKLTPYAEVLHGYYTNPNEAAAMRNGLQNVFTQSGGRIISVAYKGKKTTSSSPGGATDFWETGAKASSDSSSKEKKPVKKDDFWNN